MHRQVARERRILANVHQQVGKRRLARLERDRTASGLVRSQRIQTHIARSARVFNARHVYHVGGRAAKRQYRTADAVDHAGFQGHPTRCTCPAQRQLARSTLDGHIRCVAHNVRVRLRHQARVHTERNRAHRGTAGHSQIGVRLQVECAVDVKVQHTSAVHINRGPHRQRTHIRRPRLGTDEIQRPAPARLQVNRSQCRSHICARLHHDRMNVASRSIVAFQHEVVHSRKVRAHPHQGPCLGMQVLESRRLDERNATCRSRCIQHHVREVIAARRRHRADFDQTGHRLERDIRTLQSIQLS